MGWRCRHQHQLESAGLTGIARFRSDVYLNTDEHRSFDEVPAAGINVAGFSPIDRKYWTL